MGFSLGKTLSGAVSGFISGGPAGAVVGAGMGALDAYQDKQALKYQQKQNIKLWNMQNEYNNPKAQMQRYIDSGLNPNLIYSQQNTADDIVSATLGNSDTIGQANSLLNSRINRLQTYQQLLNMESSRRQVEAQTASIHNQIENANKLLPYQIALMNAQTAQVNASMNSAEWLSKFVGRKNSDALVDSFSRIFQGKPAKENPGRVLFRYRGLNYGF